MLIIQSAKADHIQGLDITYTKIDSVRYRFNFQIYRSCYGVTYTNYGDSSILSCGTLTKKYPLIFEKIEEITTGPKSNCNPKNTNNSGIGLERHSYYSLVDFSQTGMDSFLKCSGVLRIELTLISRNLYSTTGAQNLYSFAELNLRNAPEGNSSPYFFFDPVLYFGCNSTTNISFQGIDTVENDSLSYQFDFPKTSAKSNIFYYTGADYNRPFRAYYPGTLKYPYNNRNATPAIGTYLDPVNGSFIFAATKCDDANAYVIQIKEWRKLKDTSNKYVHVGTIRRDIMGIVRGVNVESVDLRKYKDIYTCTNKSGCIPYKLTPESKWDTLSLIISKAPHDSKTNISISNWYDSSNICFKLGEPAKLNEINIGAQAMNKASDIYLISQKIVNIISPEKTDYGIQLTKNSCNDYTFITLYKIKPSHVRWSVFKDTNHQITDTNIVVFKSSGRSETESLWDNIKFKEQGEYFVRLEILDSLLNCHSYWRSIQVPSLVENARFKFDQDSLCLGQEYELYFDSMTSSSYKFRWESKIGISNNPAYKIRLSEPYDSIKVKARLTNREECILDTVFTYFLRPYLRIPYNELTDFCEGDTLNLLEPHGYHTFVWSKSYVNAQIKSWQNEVITVSYQDIYNCAYNDTFQTHVNSLPKFDLNDTVFCGSGTIFPYLAGKHLWSDSSEYEYLFVNSSGLYSLHFIDSNDCGYTDSFQVIINPLPKIDLGKDTSICGDSIEFNLDPSWDLEWDNGANTSSIKVVFTGLYRVKATDLNGCSNTSSIYIKKLNPGNPPFLTIKGDSLISNLIGLHSWFRNDSLITTGIESFIIMNKTGNYHALRIDTNGCITARSNLITYFTGIAHEFLRHQFNIYPNPSTGKLTISASSGKLEHIKELQLFDLHGRTVQFTEIRNQDLVTILFEPSKSVLILTLRMKSGETYNTKVLVK